MGKAKIKEHLGDAQYRIALDIDVDYAQQQWEAHQAYLKEFEPKLKAAKDQRDALKAQYDAAGMALKDYLSPLQAASEAAYAAMTAAYEAWLTALQSQSPDEVAPLQKAMGDAYSAVTSAQAALITNMEEGTNSLYSHWPEHDIELQNVGNRVLARRAWLVRRTTGHLRAVYRRNAAGGI